MSAHDKSTLFHKNLEWMRPRNPSLAERMKLWTESPDVALSLSKTEKTVPVVRQVSLHSRYDPEKEARQWFQNNTVDAASFIVFGLGFGYHLDVLLEHTTSSISVIEPSLDLFCHWASEVELSRYADRVHFIVGETAAKAVSLLQDTRQPVLSHPPSIRLHEAYFKAVEAGMEFDRLTAEHPLRVLVIPPIYGGSLPTARYCFDALEALGHRAYWADCDKMAQAFHAIKGFSANREHSEILSRKFLEFISEAVVARAAEVRPDLILALAQAPLDRETVKRLKALEVPIAFWFPEDFRTLTYWQEMASAYDYFFAFQRGEFPQRLKEAGNVGYYYLPQACHPAVHKKSGPAAGLEKFSAELSFMGAPYYNRTQSFVRLLDLPFKIWGEGWDPEGVYGASLQGNGKRVSTEEAVQIFNASRININLHSSTFHEGVNPNGDFVNPRTFEIAACEGFQLVDCREELPFLFDIENELPVYSSISELRELILHFQGNPEERRRYAAAARRRVLAEHTFEHRMRELLTHIFIDHLDRFKSTLADRETEWNDLVLNSAAGTSLESYLKPFKDCESFSLKTLKEAIEKGEGELSDPELLILMVDQVVE